MKNQKESQIKAKVRKKRQSLPTAMTIVKGGIRVDRVDSIEFLGRLETKDCFGCPRFLTLLSDPRGKYPFQVVTGSGKDCPGLVPTFRLTFDDLMRLSLAVTEALATAMAHRILLDAAVDKHQASSGVLDKTSPPIT